MPIEGALPGWWEWVLFIPSLAILLAALLGGIEPERPGPAPARWTALDLLFVLFIHIGALSMGRLVDIPFLPPTWGTGALLLAADALTCLAALFVAWRSGSVEALGLFPPRKGRNLAALVLAYLAFLVPLGIVFWAWIRFLSSVGLRPTVQPALELFLEARARADWTGMAFIAAVAVVLAPLAEELLFRGILFGLLRRSLGAGTALLITSAFFASFHLMPEVILPIFLVGLVLNVIYIRTGSLAYPILFHMLFNGGTLLFMGV